MTEKKARDIVRLGFTEDDNYTLHVARGYFEAREKARELEKVLSRCCEYLKEGTGHDLILAKMVKDALVKFWETI